MCILFLHVNPNPQIGGYRLILAANRDESTKRPAKPAHVDPNTGLIGGQDMEPGKEGGTWLAFGSKQIKNSTDKRHCAAVLLNLPGIQENAKGRGQIITNYLSGTKDFQEYSDVLDQNTYNGFSLISVELSSSNATTYQYSNVPKITSSYSGNHTLAFGNSQIFNPLTKVRVGRMKFEEILKRDLNGDELKTALLGLLKDTTRNLPDEELQGRQPRFYERLSCINIVPELDYGTRTHTIILIDSDWNLKFIEHTLKEPIDCENLKWSETRIEKKL